MTGHEGFVQVRVVGEGSSGSRIRDVGVLLDTTGVAFDERMDVLALLCNHTLAASLTDLEAGIAQGDSAGVRRYFPPAVHFGLHTEELLVQVEVDTDGCSVWQE